MLDFFYIALLDFSNKIYTCYIRFIQIFNTLNPNQGRRGFETASRERVFRCSYQRETLMRQVLDTRKSYLIFLIY